MRQLRVLLCLATIFAVCSLVPAQEVRILSEAVASPPKGGGHDWYDVEADPENADNLIACGMKWNALDNAYYGFVYASQDGGKIWHTTLEDKSSKWVSEESCAFGVHGVAYFVADASKIDTAGKLHHDLGTTRIWVTHDSGRTWTLGTTAGWTDFSASVVDRNPGPNQNRLYTFFNNLWTYYASVGNKGRPANLPNFTDKINGSDTPGNTIGLISYKDRDTRVDGPVFDPEMYKQLYHGSYPSQNLLLKDGSLLTLFSSHTSKRGADGANRREFVFAAQHTNAQRNQVLEPVNIYTTTVAPAAAVCSSSLSAPAVYDPTTNTVYATYLDGSNGKCTLMLAKSTDDGQTWSSSAWTEKSASGKRDPNPAQHDYSGLALARREDGALALLWHDSDKPDLWFFATSADDGKTYSTPQQISAGIGSDGGYRLTSESLDLTIGQADEKNPADDAGLQIKNHFGFGSSHTSGIAVTPDGVFHPVWVADGGQLETAAVAVVKPRDRNKPAAARTDGWQYETNKVKFTYGGSQRYDAQDGVLAESVVILNSGTEPLKAPLRLEITSTSPVGVIYPLDVLTEGSGDSVAQYLDIGQYIPGDGLAPGASSTPILLRFHFEPNPDAKRGSHVADVSLRLLAKEPK